MEQRKTFLSVKANEKIPSFVLKEHVNFVKFVNYYYEWLDNNSFDDLQDLFLNQDINECSDDIVDYYYAIFAEGFPKNIQADKRLFLKQIYHLYLNKGTQASFEFFFKAIYGVEVDFYYPKKDILRASDGKYQQLKSIRVPYSESILNSTGKNIRGETSQAIALVESTISYFISSFRIVELFLSDISGTFALSENIQIIGQPTLYPLYGLVQSISITNPGTGYSVGQIIPILNRNPAATFDSTSKKFDSSLWTFDSSGELFTGIEAACSIKSIFKGSVESISIINSGDFYKVGDPIVFETMTEANTAYAKIDKVTKFFGTEQIRWDSSEYTFDSTSGKILNVQILGGGFNYTRIPSVTITSVSGTGGVLQANSSKIGGVKEIEITNFGLNYSSPPLINLASIGNRNAVATANVSPLAIWAGSWLNNDGFLNDKKYLIDDFYYQDFSYVLRTSVPIESYLNTIKDILHPSGFQLFSELLIENDIDLHSTLNIQTKDIFLFEDLYILSLFIDLGLFLDIEELSIESPFENAPSLNMTYEIFDEYKFLFQKANQSNIYNYYSLQTGSFEQTKKYESVDFVPDVEITDV